MIEERPGFPGALPSVGGCGGHLGAPTRADEGVSMIEERPGFPGALPSVGGCGGHLGAPTRADEGVSSVEEVLDQGAPDAEIAETLDIGVLMGGTLAVKSVRHAFSVLEQLKTGRM